MATIKCHNCNYSSARVPAKFAGKYVKCPKCGRRLTAVANQSHGSTDFPIDDDVPQALPAVKTIPLPIKPNVFRPAETTTISESSTAAKTERSEFHLNDTVILFEERSPNRSRKRSIFRLLAVCFVALFALALVVPTWKYLVQAINGPGVAQNAAQAAPNQPAANAPAVVLQRLRDYLKENTNTGKWEEIRYWPGFTISTPAQRQVLESTALSLVHGSGDSIFGDLYLDALRSLQSATAKNPQIRFARIKYRTQNIFGHPWVEDQMFVITDDNIAPIGFTEREIIESGWERFESAK